MSPSISPNTTPPVLAVPLLGQEEDPTATDLRQIQRWSTWVPRTVLAANTVTAGKVPPRFIEPLQTVGTYTGTPTSGVLTIPVAGYSYGYTPIVCAGDTTGSLGFVVVNAASCTKLQLSVTCYTPTGSLATAQVRVNYMLMGA